MFTLIKKLKARPETYRRKVSMTISLSITFIIVLVWVSTFNIGASNDYNDGTEVNNVAATATPFTTFKDDILKIKDAFVDTIDSIDTVNYKAESSE